LTVLIVWPNMAMEQPTMSPVVELHVVVARLEDELEFAPWALTKVNDAHAGATQTMNIVSNIRKYFTLNSLSKTFEPQRGGDTTKTQYSPRRHGDAETPRKVGGKQSQKQIQNPNPRTTENTENC